MSHCRKLSLENKSCPFPLPFNIKKRITTEDLTSGISRELAMLEDAEGNAFVNAPHRDQLKAVGRRDQGELQTLLKGLAGVSPGSQLCLS